MLEVDTELCDGVSAAIHFTCSDYWATPTNNQSQRHRYYVHTYMVCNLSKQTTHAVLRILGLNGWS